MYFNNTSFIPPDFCWNEVYCKYTYEFEKKNINLGNKPEIYFELEHKYINVESLLQV